MQLPAAPADCKSFRILVVEDDISIARLVLMHLQKAGFDVRMAVDGNLGWQCFQEFEPHLILLDVMMPGLCGWDLAARMRDKSKAPILMMTAANSDDDQIHGFKLGADDYVPKPFHPPVLLARVIAHLRRVYRYDAPEIRAEEPAPARHYSVPEGWNQCDSCGYLGPQYKFLALDPKKGQVFICPNCKSSKMMFSLD